MNNKPRICLIYTGGTIGMIREHKGDGYVLRPPENPKEFLRYLKAEEEIRDIAELDFVDLINKDSTNMAPADWTKMAEAIHARLDQGYQGFVVAHGTDTMHFSASALAFAFGRNLNVPIVFTGAQTSPEVAHGDARVNLLRAVKVACEDIAEVVVSFGENIFRGCRVQKKDERRFDAFESPAEFPIGYITEEIILSGLVKPRSEKSLPLEFLPDFADGIIQFSIIPGLEPETLLPVLKSDTCRGVVLQSFGAGNVPNEGAYSFKEFIEQAVALGKPVIIASQFPANSTLASHYAPGRDAVDAGAIASGNMTNATATTKLRWVLYRVEERIRRCELRQTDKLSEVGKMMSEVYVGEMTPLEKGRSEIHKPWFKRSENTW
uniref:L-asparaginase n=1 Tax=Candidatus Kentrum sp. MB TaxID=2138164 RepID=A0A450XXL3_9GAMM|nr:MAG: L-asparaginase [Candidatus Kentron sp. MB]VFK34028.1 MAG: L-asparaginase [Candidatus Kentron sp. MB]VFK76203.1 MAG: L-asparaginase [Candidatus Kentron sp. MB]